MDKVEFGKKIDAWSKLQIKRDKDKKSKDYKVYKDLRKRFDKDAEDEKKLRNDLADFVKDNGKKVRGKNAWDLTFKGKVIRAELNEQEVPAYSFVNKKLEVVENG